MPVTRSGRFETGCRSEIDAHPPGFAGHVVSSTHGDATANALQAK